MSKQYVLIDRLKLVAIEEASLKKAMANSEQPLSEASIEAKAVLQVVNYMYENNEWVDVMNNMKYDPQHKTTYNKDEVEVAPLGSPLNEPFHMNIEYNNKSAVQWLKQQYIERGETLPSGVFQEALEMEQQQMKEMYLRGIENYDPTFKRKSTWTTTKEDKAFIKS